MVHVRRGFSQTSLRALLARPGLAAHLAPARTGRSPDAAQFRHACSPAPTLIPASSVAKGPARDGVSVLSTHEHELGADADLLEAAAWLYDIGYAPGFAITGPACT